MFLRWALPLGIISWMLVAGVVVLALYEWEWVVAGLLVVAVFAVYPPRTWHVPSRPLANHRKEDDAQ